MKNRDKLLQTCTYDMLVNMANNTGICPLQAVAGISREAKILRCYKYVHDGCENAYRNGSMRISTFQQPVKKAVSIRVKYVFSANCNFCIYIVQLC